MTTEAKAFKTLGRAMKSRTFATRRPLLVAASALFAGLGNARDAATAAKVAGLAEIANYADFQTAAGL